MRYKVSIGELNNGMKVYSQHDSSGTGRLWGIGVKAGSVHDPQGMSGMAHLVEHVMCAQSKMISGEEADLLMEKFTDGPEGNINIRTDRTNTFYGPLNSLFYEQHMLTIFSMFADMLKDRIITPKSFEAERAAVNNEHYLRGQDNAEILIDELLMQALYATNPAGRPLDGSMEDVENITLVDIARFVKTYYVPENMFLTFMGPSFNKSMGLAREYFGSFNPHPAQNPFIFSPEKYADDIIPELKETRVVQVERAGIRQHHIAIGFPTETYLTKDAEALDVIVRLLAHRIKRRLRDDNRDFNKGTYRALGFSSRTSMHGVIYFWFASLDAEFARRGTDIILEECAKLKESLISPVEMNVFLTSVYYRYLDAFKTDVSSLTEMVIAAASNGDEDLAAMHERENRFKRLNRKKIREVANKYFGKHYACAKIIPV